MKKLLLSILAMSMAFTFNMGSIKAASDDLIVPNASFEEEINANDIQLYKAERTDEKAFDGTYSIKVGTEKPDYKEDVPKWQYNLGKGGVNIIVRNAEPNTKYTIKYNVWNETGVRFQSGAIDIEGSTDTPWNIGMVSNENASKSTEWKEVTQTLTTGPRTNEFYIFAYCMNQKNGKDSGAFYIDNISVSKGETVTPAVESSIGYNAMDKNEFPSTIPAIQSFDKAGGAQFELNSSYQVISADEFSKEKAEYLGDSLIDKGIIKYYELKMIDNVEEGEGIVVVKKPIQFTLPETTEVIYSEVDSYQIDINDEKVVVYSDNIEGIQNGTMTLLQALTQRSQLPAGTVKDYTDQRIRGFQIDTARTYFSVDWLKEQIEQMAYYKQNKLQLRVKDSEGIRWESEIAPELMDKDGYIYTKEDAKELVAYANKFNIEIIPEVDYPGHSEMEVDMIDNAGKKDWLIGMRYEPSIVPVLNFANPEVRKYIIDVTKEAAEFFDAKTIHLGGDEYFDITAMADEPLEDWANEVLGVKNASTSDAMKLYFNEVAGAMFDEGYNVLMWNDNIKLDGNVELDKRITLDFWAGAFKGRCLKGSEGAAAGYNVMSSSSTNYHNLWYQLRKESVRNPLPAEMYEKFTRFNYSVSSNTYEDDENLTANKDKSLGQMFPIWSDILGGVSETVLERTVFPRYAVFSYIVWGAQTENKTLTYPEMERLMFDLGAPREDIKVNSKINYNATDLNIVITEIETALDDMETDNEGIQANIDALTQKIADVKENVESYEINSFYTDIIDELIHDFENVEYVAVIEEDLNDKTELIEIFENIQDIDLELYIKETVEEFNEILKEAQKIINNPRATESEINEMIDTLNSAKDVLEYKPADYKGVEEAIAAANKLNPENYIDFNGVENAIASVDYGLKILDQDKVDAMAQAIRKAMDDLVPAFEIGDKTALLKLYDDAKQIRSKDCVEETYNALSEAINAAESVLDNPVAKQEELDAAENQLKTAIENLEYKPADYSELEAALEDLEWRIPEDFDDYSVVEKALASIVYGLDIRYQEKVDAMTDAIYDAIYDHYILYEKEYLKQALDDAYEVLEDDKDLYTNKSLEKLYAVIEEGEALLKDPNADNIYELESKIYDVIDSDLEYKADYSELNEVVAKVEALNPDKYTNFEIVSEIIDSIEWDYSENYQGEVDALVDQLEDAISKLEAVIVDKTVLNTAIIEAEKINGNLYKNYADVETALVKAREVLANEEATQVEVDLAAGELNKAVTSLLYKEADYSAVEKAIAEAKAELEKDIYTEESVKAVEDKINAVVRELDITKQEEVDAMAEAIKEAMNGLEEQHRAVYVEAKAATCTEEGNIEYWYCEHCDRYFADEALTEAICKEETIVKATGHETEIVNKKEATCEEEGYTGDEICTKCEEVIKEGTVIEKLPHNYEEGSCTECGAEDPEYTAPADKEALTEAITKAESLNAEEYEDFSAVAEALEAAKALVADEEAMQEEVDEAVKALNDAVDALEEKVEEPEPTDPEEPGEDNKPNEDTDGTGTGDTTNVAGLLALLGLAGAAIAYTTRKRMR